MTLNPKFNEWSLQQLLMVHQSGKLNLSPGFQRDSVWSKRDRQKLIESILRGKPIPNIFLYSRSGERGGVVYDVIDGKQRIETILRFVGAKGFSRDRFSAKLEVQGELVPVSWSSMNRRQSDLRHDFEKYRVQVVEIEGTLNEIIDVFVSINSTGKKLTSGEQRNAKFYKSPFLIQAQKLVRTYRSWFLQQKVLSQTQLDRMKGVELVSELLMSIHKGGVMNKKNSLDRAIGNDAINAHTLRKITKEFVATMNVIKQKFPRLVETRLRNSADFYSLFMLVWEMRQEGLVLRDRNADKAANHLLAQLSTGVDNLREHLRRASLPKDQDKVFSEYLMTVQGDTDSSASRERRRAILKKLLWSLYRHKDEKRLFSLEQRRILWHSDAEKKCAECSRTLTWDSVAVDHVLAHSRGGRTALRNAALVHPECNSRKGSGVRSRVRLLMSGTKPVRRVRRAS